MEAENGTSIYEADGSHFDFVNGRYWQFPHTCGLLGRMGILTDQDHMITDIDMDSIVAEDRKLKGNLTKK